jgi:hypothetical protein
MENSFFVFFFSHLTRLDFVGKSDLYRAQKTRDETRKAANFRISGLSSQIVGSIPFQHRMCVCCRSEAEWPTRPRC